MQHDGSILKTNSLLFWAAMVVPVGIIIVGINFLLNPTGASAGYGIPITDPSAFPYMYIKGVRDIVSGLVFLPFLLRGDRQTTATLYAIFTLIALGDGAIVLSHEGFVPAIAIHWGTAAYMVIITLFLRRNEFFGRAGRLPVLN